MAKTICNKLILYILILCFICITLPACKESSESSVSVSTSIEETNISEPTKYIFTNLDGTEQWYLENNGSYDVFFSEYSWWTDERSAEENIDIDYYKGMQIYSENRTTIVAVIDADIDTNLFLKTENLWINQAETPDDGLDNDENGYIDDIYGWNFCDQNNMLYTQGAWTTHGNNVVGALIGSDLFPEYVALGSALIFRTGW